MIPGLRFPTESIRNPGCHKTRSRHFCHSFLVLSFPQYAFYVTDSIKLGNFTINAGLRDDQYDDLVSANGVQPRFGIAYLIPHFRTVLRAAYSRTFETPFNENLILSSGTGGGGLAENVFGSDSTPIKPGRRNQFNAGLQQGIGRWAIRWLTTS
jgi:outer membrane receptor protein involved in Fe transport